MYFKVLIVFCSMVLVFGVFAFFRERTQRDDDVHVGDGVKQAGGIDLPDGEMATKHLTDGDSK
jgi:hypothetical protein